MTTTNATHSPYRATLARIATLEAQLRQDQEPQDRPTKTVADPDWDAQLAEIAADLERIERAIEDQEYDRIEANLRQHAEPGHTCPHCGGTHTTYLPQSGRLDCFECGAVTLDTDPQPVTAEDIDRAPNVCRTYAGLVQGGYDFWSVHDIAEDVCSFTTRKDLLGLLANVGVTGGVSTHRKADLASLLVTHMVLNVNL